MLSPPCPNPWTPLTISPLPLGPGTINSGMRSILAVSLSCNYGLICSLALGLTFNSSSALLFLCSVYKFVAVGEQSAPLLASALTTHPTSVLSQGHKLIWAGYGLTLHDILSRRLGRALPRSWDFPNKHSKEKRGTWELLKEKDYWPAALPMLPPHHFPLQLLWKGQQLLCPEYCLYGITLAGAA